MELLTHTSNIGLMQAKTATTKANIYHKSQFVATNLPLAVLPTYLHWRCRSPELSCTAAVLDPALQMPSAAPQTHDTGQQLAVLVSGDNKNNKLDI